MKKALIITYYWPPAGGAGVQRALKFVKYLPQFGWEPVVLTVENPDSPVEDESLLADIPEGTKIYKTKSLEPFELYKKFTGKNPDSKIPNDVLVSKKNLSTKEKIANWIRLNVFIPDAKIGWKHYAVKEGLKIIEKENIDLIFTTSPPHTIQLIGNSLAKKTKLKWVADYRDPWMELIHYQTNKRFKLAVYIESIIEKNILKNCNRIITVSNAIKELFSNKADNLKIDIIPNGYDDTDLSVMSNNNKKSDLFTITYTGIISNTKIPYALLLAVKKLKEEDNSNIRIVFAGKIPTEFNDTILNNGLNENFTFKGYVSHKESVELLVTSDVLLLIIDNIPNNKGILTGKLFEYMGTKKPIFAIGPVDGDANKLLYDTNSGVMIDYNDADGAYLLLKKLYDDWKNNNSSFTFDVEQFSRKNLTRKLAEIFDGVLR